MQRKLVTVVGHGDGEVVQKADEGNLLLTTIQQNRMDGAPDAASPRDLRPHINHRLAVFDAHGAIVDIFSQSDVIRFLHARASSCPPPHPDPTPPHPAPPRPAFAVICRSAATY